VIYGLEFKTAYGDYRECADEDRATLDATSYACIDPGQRAAATIIAKQECILAGLGCVPRILEAYARSMEQSLRTMSYEPSVDF